MVVQQRSLVLQLHRVALVMRWQRAVEQDGLEAGGAAVSLPRQSVVLGTAVTAIR